MEGLRDGGRNRRRNRRRDNSFSPFRCRSHRYSVLCAKFILSTMLYRVLGRTGISVSRVAFGAGPISGLMVGNDAHWQRAVIEYAISRGINWFDTAATYGDGQSERNLGRVLQELHPAAA